MLGLIEITGWHYAGFIAVVLVFLELDLGVFHRHAHVVRFKAALLWTAVWVCMAMLFAFGLKVLRGEQESPRMGSNYRRGDPSPDGQR